MYKFLDEGESGVFTLDQVHEKLHQFSDSEAFFSKCHLKQKLIEKYYNNIYFTSEIGRKDVICFRSSLNEILREHLANKSENPEDQENPGEMKKISSYNSPYKLPNIC